MNNPIKSTFAGIFFGSPLVDYYLRRRASKELRSPVYAKIVKGSRPSYVEQLLPRAELHKTIAKIFSPEPVIEEAMLKGGMNTRFGVVVGPSGCGKTYLMRKFCNEHPSGVVYFEMTNACSFVSSLSKELGMKTEPRTVLDLMLGYVSENYTHYHRLPDALDAALSKVLEVFENEALRYRKEAKKIPVLVIDGVDILAKKNEDLCCQLITTAKVLANDNRVKMVFLVSSEGAVVPLMERMSAMNRALTYEIGDVTDDESFNLLIKSGIPKMLSKALVDIIGGRLVYLQSAVRLIITEKVDDIELIKLNLFESILNVQAKAITVLKPESDIILNILSKDDIIVTRQLFTASMDEEGEKRMNKALAVMIENNTLRYTTNGAITWHGRIQKNQFKATTTS